MAILSPQKRFLGKTGIAVSEIGVGLWAAGGGLWGKNDDQAILDMIDAALTAGITFFDTADVYGDGHSEELLGLAMKGRRDQFIVATKIGWAGYNREKGISAYDTPDKLIQGVETNLTRLKTDYIDIIQCHLSIKDPTMDSFLEGFRQLKKSGKVRAFGLSTSRFDYIKAFNSNDDCATLQIDYSILNRTAESEIFPYCRVHNIGIIVRGALAMGILTGKFSKNSTFPGDDFRSRWIDNEDEHQVFLNDLRIVEELKKITRDKTPAQLALKFVLANPDISVVIPGARSVKQVTENIRTCYLDELRVEELKTINKLVPPGGGRKIWPA